VLARVPVPALGVAGVRPVPAAPAPQADGFGNGLLTVRVAADGTLAIDGVAAGLARLVDGGEAGDSYNHAPPDDDLVVDKPLGVDVAVLERGPLRWRVEITRRYAWPAASGPARRADETVATGVVTTAELRAGEPFLRLEVRFDNRATDHRLRLHLPLPAPVTGSYAEGQFAVVHRGLTAEGGHGEAPLPTFPASGFVAVDGLAVLLTQPTEYEVVGDGRELALTVLRAFGRISRNDHPLRTDPAGPEVPTPGAQGLGPQVFACALLPGSGPPGPATLAALEHYLHPLRAAPGAGPDGPLPALEGLRLGGDGVALSALRRVGDELEVRVVNQQDRPVTARLSGGVSAARRTDLLGRPGDDLTAGNGAVELPLGPWELATLRLRR
jgi:alpha-mannosidase